MDSYHLSFIDDWFFNSILYLKDERKKNMIQIRFAQSDDFESVKGLDPYLDATLFSYKITLQQIIVAENEDKILGVLRYGLFWDHIPFINMIMVKESSRNQKIGTKLMDWFENWMIQKHYHSVMTSSLACESGQHFFRGKGYRDCGSLFIEKEGAEILFMKDLIVR
jgi:GNAT superfamily N-acetyltransferase